MFTKSDVVHIDGIADPFLQPVSVSGYTEGVPDTHSIVFCGTPQFAVPSLMALARDPRYEVQLVITQPDRPVGRKQILTPPPVKQAAQELGLPVIQPKNINTVRDKLPEQFDYLVVVAYGQILRQSLLEAPRIAPINLHASLLPHWRGAAPIQNALLANDKETGVSIQRMVRTLDAGPIYAAATTPIDKRETAETLHDHLAAMGADLLAHTLADLPEPTPQSEAEITVCHKLERSDGFIDPARMTAEEIDRKTRALTPWPGVTWPEKNLKLIETDLEPTPDAFALPCQGNTTLYLRTVQPAGRNPMSGKDWGRGQKGHA